FVPRQPKESMPAFWSVCDVALVHLRDDPVFATVIPSKIFEAMAVGRPVLFVGREGDGWDIVSKHNAGIRVPPGNPSALADAVTKLVADRQSVQTMGLAGLKAASEYSRVRQASATLESLRKAIEGPRP